MTARKETAAPQFFALVTGHHVAAPGYVTWRTQGTDDYLLMLTLSGSGRVCWAGGEYRTKVGDLMLLHPQVRHDYGIAPEADCWEILWAHFIPYQHWRDWLDWPKLAPGIVRLGVEDCEAETAAINAALGEMHKRATSGRVRREAWAMNALEEVLLRCDTVNPASHAALRDTRIADAVRHLRQHFAEPFYLPEVATRVGLSVSRLSHLFTEQMGQTPRQFVEEERLARASQLLVFTARPVHAIASEVGYENPFYFTLRFKARFGLAPRDYRLRWGGQEKPGSNT